jgi:hypothetical protein
MPEYRRWTSWITWSKIAWPYAQQLLSNEIYVYTPPSAMNALFSFTPFVILMVSLSRYSLPNSGMDVQIYDTWSITFRSPMQRRRPTIQAIWIS